MLTFSNTFILPDCVVHEIFLKIFLLGDVDIPLFLFVCDMKFPLNQLTLSFLSSELVVMEESFSF